MDRRLKASIVLAVPLAAAAIGGSMLSDPREVKVAAPRAIVEHCRRAAELLYDVTWAATCTALAKKNAGDDSPDCTLPDADAAKVNAILQAEETRCLAVEAHAAR